MPFTLLDGILLLVVLISAVLAMIRGFTREVFSIGSWVAAAAVAYFFWDDVLALRAALHRGQEPRARRHHRRASSSSRSSSCRIITMRISDFVLDSRAGPLDRTLGFVFGAARGLILVIIAVLFLNFFIAPDRQPEWIAMAKSKPWLDSLGTDLMNRLPDDPEAEIMQRLRGEAAGHAGDAARAGADAESIPAPDADADGRRPRTPPADGRARAIAPDDQNQLERQLEAPPPD